MVKVVVLCVELHVEQSRKPHTLRERRRGVHPFADVPRHLNVRQIDGDEGQFKPGAGHAAHRQNERDAVRQDEVDRVHAVSCPNAR